MTDLIYGSEARKKMFNGISKVATAVKTTLGPCGKLVAFKKDGSLTFSKDGVTVGKMINLEDPAEDFGASLIKEVATKTNIEAGDNTTTATVLAYAIVKEGLKVVETGVKPLDLINGIKRAKEDIVIELEKAKEEVNEKNLCSVAAISANNDPEIGNMISEVMSKVGKDGIITTEESNNLNSKVEIVEGLQLQEGMISPYFASNKERMETELDKSYVLVTDKKISSMVQLVPILDQVIKSGNPVITIICEDMDGEALSTLILNNVRGTLKSVVVRAPSFGDNRKNWLKDIAAVTGATLISADLGNSLENATLEMLGKAKIKSNLTKTTITQGAGIYDDILEGLKVQMKDEDKYTADRAKVRYARLTSGVAVIKIGANTPLELTEKKFRVEDTIAATRAALEEGIVAGGGVALVSASAAAEKNNKSDDVGYNILISAVKEPLKQIAENSGVNGEVVLNKVLESNDHRYGYNAKDGVYGDMISMGVIDTLKGIKAALKNAVSIATLLLSTECSILEKKDKNKNTIATPYGEMPM